MNDELGFTEEQLNQAIDLLIESGLAEVREGKNGEPEYHLTDAGTAAADAVTDLMWESQTDARLLDLHKRLTRLERTLYGGTKG